MKPGLFAFRFWEFLMGLAFAAVLVLSFLASDLCLEGDTKGALICAGGVVAMALTIWGCAAEIKLAKWRLDV